MPQDTVRTRPCLFGGLVPSFPPAGGAISTSEVLMVNTHKPGKRITSWTVLPQSGVILVFGHRGGGKSALAWQLAEQAHKSEKPVLCLGMSTRVRRRFPSWVRHLADYAALQRHRGAFVIVDEAAFQASARRHQSPENIAWTRLVAICRHSRHLLLFVAQSSRALDVGIVSEADWVCFKKPSILHIRFSRPEFRPDVEEAYRCLIAKRSKAWTFIKEYGDGAVGLLRNPVPSWWSEEASEAFALVPLEAQEKPRTRGGVSPLSRGKKCKASRGSPSGSPSHSQRCQRT